MIAERAYALEWASCPEECNRPEDYVVDLATLAPGESYHCPDCMAMLELDLPDAMMLLRPA